MKEFFKCWNPNSKSLFLLENINVILKNYEEMGYKLTLRQLYYQLVSKDIIPNSISEYNKIGNIVTNGRLSGLIDWNMIEDRIRIPKIRSSWDSPQNIIETAAYSYHISRWQNQHSYIEVWCEKDAVSNIIEPVCRELDVVFMANRGYSSQTAMYEASKRINQNIDDKNVVIIYVGDHDPSGIDMTRDIDERLGMFTYSGKKFGCVDRVALNMDQIQKFNPPENPAKLTDSRFMSYYKKYGSSSWELDAIEPKVLEKIIRSKIESYIDFDKWKEIEDLEKKHKDKIMRISENYYDLDI